MRTLDECVQGDYPECLEPLQVLIKYFCGTDMKKCGMMNRHVGHDWTKVSFTFLFENVQEYQNGSKLKGAKFDQIFH